MRPEQTGNFPPGSRRPDSDRYERRYLLRSSWFTGRLFGLLMGTTAVSIVLAPAITGKPPLLILRLTTLMIFGLFSMILVMRETRNGAEEG